MSDKCNQCDYAATSTRNLEDHKKTAHVSVQCNQCDYAATSTRNLEDHKKTVHMKPFVNITLSEQEVIKCNKCEFKCRLNIQLKKHSEKKHREEQYSCNRCVYRSNHVAQLWKHILNAHPGKDFKFDTKEKDDILINLAAEQNVEVLEEISKIRAGQIESFEYMNN